MKDVLAPNNTIVLSDTLKNKDTTQLLGYKGSHDIALYDKKIGKHLNSFVSTDNLLTKEKKSVILHKEHIINFESQPIDNPDIFNNLLVDFSLDLDRTLIQINSLGSYTNEHLNNFLIALKVVKNINVLQTELILESFIRIIHFFEKSKIHYNIDYSSQGIVFLQNLATQNIDIDKDDRINLLAFLVSKILNSEPCTYTFNYDFYVYIELEYFYKRNYGKTVFIYDCEHPIVKCMLLNWAKSQQSHYIYIEDTDKIFENQIKYCADIDLLVELLENKKSYKLILLKIDFLKKYKYNIIKHILVASYNYDKLSEDEVKILRKIFLMLNDDNILIDFIRKTKTNALSNEFFCISNIAINCYYVEALLICIQSIEQINDYMLKQLITSKYITFITDELQHFLQIIKLIQRRNLITIQFIKMLFDKQQNYSMISYIFQKLHYCVTYIKLDNHEIVTYIGKIFYSTLKTIHTGLDHQTKMIVIDIFLKLKNLKYLKETYKKTSILLIDTLKEILKKENLDIFIINCLKYCKNKDIDIGSLDYFKCSPNYINNLIYYVISNSSENNLIKEGYHIINGNINIKTQSREFILVVEYNVENKLIIEIVGDKQFEKVIIDLNGVIQFASCDYTKIISSNYVPTSSNIVHMKYSKSALIISTAIETKMIKISYVNELHISNDNSQIVVIKQLIFYELNIFINYNYDKRDIYQLFFKPLSKLLEFYQKRGIFMNRQLIQFNSNEVDYELNNIIKYYK
ncbi:hypothetical protein EBI_27177 [Enterocytozoon bieneusi H348]|nr:hypothetical protein EBI_27177 [Enterocytozoon bieneusi H348]|eukprot:XP_002650443.1 hypothetical protein EBI_27177 [Enterocytozoon bieneusi H348]